MLPTFSLLLSKGGLKGKETVHCPVFPFPSVSSFLAYVVGRYREVRGGRKSRTGFLGHLCFLECHCLLLVIEANSGSSGKNLLGAVKSPHLLSPRCNVLTLYSLFEAHWGSHALWVYWCSVLLGCVINAVCEWGT